jgi:hypothetical protein
MSAEKSSPPGGQTCKSFKPGSGRPSSRLPLFFLTALLLLLLPGCASLRDPETSQEQSGQLAGVADAVVPLGQSFTTRRPGLDQVTLWAGVHTPGEDGSVPLTFELYVPHEPGPRVSLERRVTGDGPLTFSFSPQFDPPGQEYRVHLLTRSGSLVFYGREEDAYPFGQALSGEEAASGDLAFRTTYRYGPPAALEDALLLLRQGGLLLALALLLLGPGWLLLDLLDLHRFFDPGERAAAALGLGLALLPLLMLWSGLAGLRWGWTGVPVGVFLAAAAIAWQTLRRPFRFRWSWSGLVLLGIFLLALWLRLAMVRDLAAPAWVDSVHHALITRLILINGGFPESYAPYVQAGPAQYHAGFHSGLAAFVWLTRLDLPESLLFYGQVLNAAAAPAAYLFTTTLTRSRPAGLAAALLVAFVTPMPAYYASWGRYTQLAALLILPAALALLRAAWQPGERPDGGAPGGGVRWQALVGAVLALGGLLLVHYRVAAFGALLLAAYALSRVPLSRQGLGGWAVRTAVSGAVLAVGAVLVSAPQSLATLAQSVLPALAPERMVQAAPFSDFSWGYLTAGLGTWSLYLAGVGAALGLLRQPRTVLAVGGWVGLMFILANLGALGLPGGRFVNNTAVQISLFLPIALLGGYTLASALDLLRAPWPAAALSRLPGLPRLDRLRLPLRLAILLAFLVLLAAGGRQLLTLLNPVTELFRQGDRQAMAWVRAHIPEQETLLTNPFSWGYGIYAGADGGAWIPALTGRRSLPPPVLYAFGPVEDVRRTSELARAVVARGGDALGLSALMQEEGLQYVYLGARGGPISALALEESGLFRKLYDQAGVRIYLLER